MEANNNRNTINQHVERLQKEGYMPLYTTGSKLYLKKKSGPMEYSKLHQGAGHIDLPYKPMSLLFADHGE